MAEFFVTVVIAVEAGNAQHAEDVVREHMEIANDSNIEGASGIIVQKQVMQVKAEPVE